MGVFSSTFLKRTVSVSLRNVSSVPPYTGWTNVATPAAGSTDAKLLAGINGDSLFYTSGTMPANNVAFSMVAGVIAFCWNLSSSILSVDGLAKSYFGLPAGFRLLSARLDFTPTIDLNTNGASAPNTLAGSIKVDVKTQNGTTSSSNNSTTLLSLPAVSLVYTLGASSSPTILDVLLNGIILTLNGSVTKSILGGYMAFEIPGQVTLSGTYDILNFSWTLDTSPTAVQPGDLITITSGNGGLTNIDKVKIGYFDTTGTYQTVDATANIVTQTANLLTFTLPSFGGFSPIVFVMVGGDGVQFSGSVALGYLTTLYFTNGSGIYKMVSGKITDSVYLQGTGEVIEVKIPNPFFKTGYIGG